jgi:hypothetical protein
MGGQNPETNFEAKNTIKFVDHVGSIFDRFWDMSDPRKTTARGQVKEGEERREKAKGKQE